MSKKISDVQRTTEFFETADLAVANTVFEIVKGIMKRKAGTKPTVKTTAKKTTKTSAAAEPAATESVS